MRIKMSFFSLIIICTVMIGISSFTSEAAGLTAGVTAALSESLAEHAGAYKAAGKLPVKLPTTGTSEKEEPKDEKPVIIYGFSNLGIANVESNLNIRKEPGTDKALVGKLPRNAGCEILEVVGDWCKISSGKVTGYVSSEYLLTGEEAAARAEEVKYMVAVVNATSVHLRTQPSTECSILATMPEGEELTFLEDLGEWIKVEVDNAEAYVSSQYVDVSAQLPKAMTMTEIRFGQGVSDVRVELINYACQFVGNPYVWGGTSLTNGADCSGFVLKVYEKFGITLPHYSGWQANYGTAINPADAKPGDLFFYASVDIIDHVAIYIGNGQIVHASSPTRGIIISAAFNRNPVKVTSLLD